jgi:hypothetical protein
MKNINSNGGGDTLGYGGHSTILMKDGLKSILKNWSL